MIAVQASRKSSKAALACCPTSAFFLTVCRVARPTHACKGVDTLASTFRNFTNAQQIRHLSHLMFRLDDARPGLVVSSRDFPAWSNTTCREFSSRRRGRDDKAKSTILANEELLVALRKKFSNANGPTEIEVRLVIDEGGENPSTVKVCSLAEAIEISLDRTADLIGVALQNDPPVIRATRLSKLEYQNEQAVAKQKAAAKSKQSKTFRFRASIDENDLNRKIENMIKFLEEGVECEYTVFSKARILRENATAGMELVERIQEMVADCAVQKTAPQVNEHGNHIRVRLMPKKSSI